MTTRRRLVRVPASSANLGPGYDVLAAALALHLELEVEETGEFSFDPGGLDVSTGRAILVAFIGWLLLFIPMLMLGLEARPAA